MDRKRAKIHVGQWSGPTKYRYRVLCKYDFFGEKLSWFARNQPEFIENIEKEIKNWVKSKENFNDFLLSKEFVFFVNEKDMFEFLITFGDIVEEHLSFEKHNKLRFPG